MSRFFGHKTDSTFFCGHHHFCLDEYGQRFLGLLAGLQGLPTEVYESARIDGVKQMAGAVVYYSAAHEAAIIIRFH